MTDQNPYRRRTQGSGKPRPPASTSRSRLSRFLAAAAAGAIIGTAASIAAVFLIALLVGHMDYEMSGLVAVFVGTATAVPATIIGVVIGQGHPNAWDDKRWEGFVKIIEFLKSRGCVFMTPSEYLAGAGR